MGPMGPMDPMRLPVGPLERPLIPVSTMPFLLPLDLRLQEAFLVRQDLRPWVATLVPQVLHQVDSQAQRGRLQALMAALLDHLQADMPLHLDHLRGDMLVHPDLHQFQTESMDRRQCPLDKVKE